MSRTYAQNCGMARALDVIGERWTLLIVRELMLGPQRYRDLHAALPSMGTNLLADRLKAMTSEGLIERAPDGEGYRLTAHGDGLRPAMEALALWGLDRVRLDEPGTTTRASWAALTMRSAFDPANAPDRDLVAALEVGDEHLWLGVVGGAAHTGTTAPPPREPDVRARLTTFAFLSLATGHPAPAGEVELQSGAGADLAAVFDALPLPAEA